MMIQEIIDKNPEERIFVLDEKEYEEAHKEFINTYFEGKDFFNGKSSVFTVKKNCEEYRFEKIDSAKIVEIKKVNFGENLYYFTFDKFIFKYGSVFTNKFKSKVQAKICSLADWSLDAEIVECENGWKYLVDTNVSFSKEEFDFKVGDDCKLLYYISDLV